MDQLITQAPRLLIPGVGETASILLLLVALVAAAILGIVLLAKALSHPKPKTDSSDSPKQHQQALSAR